MKSRPRAVLLTASTIHFLHDGFSETLYVFLPLWAAEFGLSFSQVGLIRTAYTGGMSAFQIPAGFMAERFGERRLLALGTAVTALGFIALGFIAVGWAGGFASLLALLLCAGLGSGVQHPLSSSIVSMDHGIGRSSRTWSVLARLVEFRVSSGSAPIRRRRSKTRSTLVPTA